MLLPSTDQSYEEVFSIESSTGIVVLKKQLDRSQQSVYEVKISVLVRFKENCT